MANKRRYPAWPGRDRGDQIALRGELRGRRWLGYGRQSSTLAGDDPSTEDQADDFWDAVAEFEGSAADSTWRADPNAPASVGSRPRPDFEATMTEVRANQSLSEDERAVGAWFVHSSRQTRGDVNIYTYAEEFADAGMLINVGRILNPRNEDDLGILAKMYIEDRAASAAIAVHTTKNMRKALRNGRPPQRPAYGLVRKYEPTSGRKKIFRDIADWDGGELAGRWPDWDAGGRSTAPARIAELIFWWIEHGQEIGEIVQRLNARGIRPPGKARSWTRQRVIYIAGNPLYKGHRFHDPKDASRAARLDAIFPLKDGVELKYDVLVKPVQFDAVQEMLTRHVPARRVRGDEPGSEAPGFHQSTTLIRCDGCREKLTAGRARCRCAECAAKRAAGEDSVHAPGPWKLRCPAGHTTALEAEVDDEIDARIVLWSCREDVREHLREAAESGAGTAAKAREKARKLRVAAKALQPDLDKATDDRKIVMLADKILALNDEADQVEAEGWQASLSTELARLLTIGEKGAKAAEDHWAALPVSTRKTVTGEVAEFRLARSEPGRKCYYGADGVRMLDTRRLRQTWKLGPAASLDVCADLAPADAPPPRTELARQAVLAHLAREPGSTAAAIADAAGLPRPTMYTLVTRMRKAGEIIPDRPGRGCRQRPVLYTLAG